MQHHNEPDDWTARAILYYVLGHGVCPWLSWNIKVKCLTLHALT